MASTYTQLKKGSAGNEVNALQEALKAISPVCAASRMPDIPYWICSDGEDEVFPEAQCDQYVETLQKQGHSVAYHRQPGLKHGGFIPEVREELQLPPRGFG